MIRKEYVCDLCKCRAVDDNPSQRPAQRIFWAGPKITLCNLSDHKASETVICGSCLNELKTALGKTS